MPVRATRSDGGTLAEERSSRRANPADWNCVQIALWLLAVLLRDRFCKRSLLTEQFRSLRPPVMSSRTRAFPGRVKAVFSALLEPQQNLHSELLKALVMQNSKAFLMPGNTSPILDLSPELLAEVCHWLPYRELLKTCQVVCRKFAQALQQPSKFFQTLDLTRVDLSSAGIGTGRTLAALSLPWAEPHSSFLPWLQKRAQSLQWIRAAVGEMNAILATTVLRHIFKISSRGLMGLEKVHENLSSEDGLDASLFGGPLLEFCNLQNLDVALWGPLEDVHLVCLASLARLMTISLVYGGLYGPEGGFRFSSLQPLASLKKLDSLHLVNGGLSHASGAATLACSYLKLSGGSQLSLEGLRIAHHLKYLTLIPGGCSHDQQNPWWGPLAGLTGLNSLHVRWPLLSSIEGPLLAFDGLTSAFSLTHLRTFRLENVDAPYPGLQGNCHTSEQSKFDESVDGRGQPHSRTPC